MIIIVYIYKVVVRGLGLKVGLDKKLLLIDRVVFGNICEFVLLF